MRAGSGWQDARVWVSLGNINGNQRRTPNVQPPTSNGCIRWTFGVRCSRLDDVLTHREAHPLLLPCSKCLNLAANYGVWHCDYATDSTSSYEIICVFRRADSRFAVARGSG